MHACICSGRLFQRPRLLPAFSNLGTHPAVEGAGELMVRPSLLIVRSPSVNFPALVLQGEQVRQRGAPEWDACLVQATPFILPRVAHSVYDVRFSSGTNTGSGLAFRCMVTA